MIRSGERPLRRVLADFVGHYHHREHNHQKLGIELIDGVGGSAPEGPRPTDVSGLVAILEKRDLSP